jgi:DNA replication protein DnaC
MTPQPGNETAKPLNQILATLELPKPAPATATRPVRSLKDRQWCDKWLRLNTSRHPQLQELEAAVFDFCVGFRKTPGVGELLVLYGNNGAGKTHCAKAVARWASHVVGSLPKVVMSETHLEIPSVMLVHWPTLLDDLKAGKWFQVDDAENATLLILDEVGGGHDPSLMGLDKLCRILSAREKKWTLATTNFLPDAWEEIFDRRVVSRLFRSANHVDLSQVPDYSIA